MSKSELDSFVQRAYQVYTSIPENTDNTIDVGQFVREASLLKRDFYSYRKALKQSNKITSITLYILIWVFFVIGIALSFVVAFTNTILSEETHYFYKGIICFNIFCILSIFPRLSYITFKDESRSINALSVTNLSQDNFPNEHNPYKKQWKEFDNLMQVFEDFQTKKKFNPITNTVNELGNAYINSDLRIIENYKNKFQGLYMVNESSFEGVSKKNFVLEKESVIEKINKVVNHISDISSKKDFDSQTRQLLSSLFLNAETPMSDCPNIYQPVCGKNSNITYKNACVAELSGETNYTKGDCGYISCSDTYTPVNDGKYTYHNQCVFLQNTNNIQSLRQGVSREKQFTVDNDGDGMNIDTIHASLKGIAHPGNSNDDTVILQNAIEDMSGNVYLNRCVGDNISNIRIQKEDLRDETENRQQTLQTLRKYRDALQFNTNDTNDDNDIVESKHQQLIALQNKVLLNTFPLFQDEIAQVPSKYPLAHTHIIVRSITNQRKFQTINEEDVKQYLYKELNRSTNNTTYIGGMKSNIANYLRIVFEDSNNLLENKEFTSIPGHIDFLTLYRQMRSMSLTEIQKKITKWDSIQKSIKDMRTKEPEMSRMRQVRNNMILYYFFAITICVNVLSFGFFEAHLIYKRNDIENKILKIANYILLTFVVVFIIGSLPFRWYAMQSQTHDIKETNTKSMEFSAGNARIYLEEIKKEAEESSKNTTDTLGNIIGKDISTETIYDYLQTSYTGGQIPSIMEKAHFYYIEYTRFSRIYKQDHYITSEKVAVPFPVFGMIIRVVILIIILIAIFWILRQHNPVSMAKFVPQNSQEEFLNSEYIQLIISFVFLFILIVGMSINIHQLRKSSDNSSTLQTDILQQ